MIYVEDGNDFGTQLRWKKHLESLDLDSTKESICLCGPSKILKARRAQRRKNNDSKQQIGADAVQLNKTSINSEFHFPSKNFRQKSWSLQRKQLNNGISNYNSNNNMCDDRLDDEDET